MQLGLSLDAVTSKLRVQILGMSHLGVPEPIPYPGSPNDARLGQWHRSMLL
jgi:hypothetical protein